MLEKGKFLGDEEDTDEEGREQRESELFMF